MSDAKSPPRPRGRPRFTERRTTVCTWLPSSEHDRLIRQANAREMSVSSYVRKLLVLTLDGGLGK